MSIHPEDAMAYAEQLHVDFAAAVAAVNHLSGQVERVAVSMERAFENGVLYVKDAGRA